MTDLYNQWGSDLIVAANGDLLLTPDDSTEGQQRVLRRLLTNPPPLDSAGNVISAGEYVWHPEYGAGVRGMIGMATRAADVRSAIRAQLFDEPVVARAPDPVIDVTMLPGNLSVAIAYNDSLVNAPAVISFDVNS